MHFSGWMECLATFFPRLVTAPPPVFIAHCRFVWCGKTGFFFDTHPFLVLFALPLLLPFLASLCCCHVCFINGMVERLTSAKTWQYHSLRGWVIFFFYKVMLIGFGAGTPTRVVYTANGCEGFFFWTFLTKNVHFGMGISFFKSSCDWQVQKLECLVGLFFFHKKKLKVPLPSLDFT